MRNFHIPLPDEVHSGLKAESHRTNRPATALAREAIEHWLRDQEKRHRHDSIVAFAKEHGGSPIDLDNVLEKASIEHWLDLDSELKVRGPDASARLESS